MFCVRYTHWMLKFEQILRYCEIGNNFQESLNSNLRAEVIVIMVSETCVYLTAPELDSTRRKKIQKN